MKILPPDIVRKSHDTPSASGADGVVQIEHFVTDDLLDGRPTVPGFADDGLLWARVTSLPDGRSLWRRVYIQPNTVFRSASRTTVNHRRHKTRSRQ